MTLRSGSLTGIALALLLGAPVLAASARATSAPLSSPPTQPATGPGGADYAFDRVIGAHYGAQARGYWLFEPADPRTGGTGSQVRSFPVVLFVGGCCETVSGDDISKPPDVYLNWIDHLVRRGAIVVHAIARLGHAQEDLAEVMRTAMAELASGAHVAADWTRFAAAGTSFGGFAIPVFAGEAAGGGLPVPRAVLAMVPGAVDTVPDLSAIPPTTRVVVLVVEDEELPGVEWTARQIWAALTSVPLDRRDFVRVRSDRRGEPPLLADHLTPRASPHDDSAPTNALDWFGTWKLLDALMSCSFTAVWCDYALGNTPGQRFMGRWSDGVPVTELEVTDNPRPPTTATRG